MWGFRHLGAVVRLLLLFLAIPIPAIIFNQITFPLQLLASRFGEFTIATCGIPVLREGNVIILATTTLEVAEACSGIRSLVSLLTLAVVWGYLTDSPTWLRWLLALSSVPIAIFANGIRVAGTGVAAHFIGPKAADGFLHTFSGWMVFVVAGVLMLRGASAGGLAGPGGVCPTEANAPTVEATPGPPRPSRRWLIRGVVARPSLARRRPRAPDTDRGGRAAPAARDAAAQVGAWEEGRRPASTPVCWSRSGSTSTSAGSTAPGGPWISLYVGYYRDPAAGPDHALALSTACRGPGGSRSGPGDRALTAGRRPGVGTRRDQPPDHPERVGAAARPLLVPGARPDRGERVLGEDLHRG